jgi:hypothetical protein
MTYSSSGRRLFPCPAMSFGHWGVQELNPGPAAPKRRKQGLLEAAKASVSSADPATSLFRGIFHEASPTLLGTQGKGQMTQLLPTWHFLAYALVSVILNT